MQNHASESVKPHSLLQGNFGVCIFLSMLKKLHINFVSGYIHALLEKVNAVSVARITKQKCSFNACTIITACIIIGTQCKMSWEDSH